MMFRRALLMPGWTMGWYHFDGRTLQLSLSDNKTVTQRPHTGKLHAAGGVTSSPLLQTAIASGITPMAITLLMTGGAVKLALRAIVV
jgi:hypothetical protein